MADAAALARAVAGRLEDPDRRAGVGEAARHAAATRHGAVQATLDLIERYLVSPEAPP